MEGYASATSVNPGEWINFYVSTTEGFYSLEIFRMGYYNGDGGRRMLSGSFYNVTGLNQPTPSRQTANGDLLECNWVRSDLSGQSAAGSLQIPSTWISGVYVGKLTSGVTLKQSYIVFVVREDKRASDFLFQVSFTTYLAYNGWGGVSNYGANMIPLGNNGDIHKLSFERPFFTSHSDAARYGNGAGHFFAREISSNAFGGWEYNMIRFMERQGYDVTYCSNVDTHVNPRLLYSHRGFLSVGHDEYWTAEARLNVEKARDAGIGLAFFSGNQVWNRVRFEDSYMNGAFTPLRTMVTVEQYPQTNANYPPLWAGNFHIDNWSEETLIGGYWSGSECTDWTIHSTIPHWASVNTGFIPGTTVIPALGGYESNGCYNSSLCPSNRLFVAASSNQQAILYTSSSGATVFSANTVQWSYFLDDWNLFGQPTVGPCSYPRASMVNTGMQTLTNNLLNRLLDAKSYQIAHLPHGGIFTIKSGSAGQYLSDNNGVASIIDFPASNPKIAYWNISRCFNTSLASQAQAPFKATVERSSPNDMWYTVVNTNSGKYLSAVTSGGVFTTSTLSTSNLQSYWRIVRNTDIGSTNSIYYLQSVSTGQVMLVSNNGAAGGAVVVLGDAAGWGEAESNNQKQWNLESPTLAGSYLVFSALDNTGSFNKQCLIFSGNGYATNPQRYMWAGTNDNDTCQLPGGASALIANRQAIWKFSLVPGKTNTYTITSKASGTEMCLINTGTYPSRFLWFDTSDITKCNANSITWQMEWNVYNLGNDKYTITYAPNGGAEKCLIFSGNAHNQYPSLYNWGDTTDVVTCGLTGGVNAVLNNGQAVWIIKRIA